MWWMGIAVGRGIEISGSQRLLTRYTQLYGYDYGGYGKHAKWTEYQRQLQDEDKPYRIVMKHGWAQVQVG